jgi:hypothetical protein
MSVITSSLASATRYRLSPDPVPKSVFFSTSDLQGSSRCEWQLVGHNRDQLNQSRLEITKYALFTLVGIAGTTWDVSDLVNGTIPAGDPPPPTEAKPPGAPRLSRVRFG